jgi:hypothetical protein
LAVITIALCGLPTNVALVRNISPLIAEAYSPFGITIRFVDGPTFANDPEQNHSWDEVKYSLLSAAVGARPPGPAYLVATVHPPGYDYLINGMLLDPMRGIAAVYMGAKIYGPGGPASRPDLLAQVCIHEVGHMLDLTHADAAGDPYCSAMQQANDRMQQSLPIAWAGALHDAAARGEPLIRQPNPTLYYPFSVQCRACLRAAAGDPRWLPYASPLRGDPQGGAEDIYRMLKVQVRPHNENAEGVVDGALYVTLAVENVTSAPVDLPAYLTPEDETLRLVIRPPNGDAYWYRPRALRCSDARAVILPGQRLFRSLAIVGTTMHPLFREPGRHHCDFQIVDHTGERSAVLGSAAIDIEVREATAEGASGRLLARRLERRLPRAKAVAIPPTETICGAALADHHELLNARTRRIAGRREAELSKLLESAAPLAIRHDAARRLARSRIEEGASWQQLETVFRQRLQGAEHEEFFDGLKRMGQGWTRMKGMDASVV